MKTTRLVSEQCEVPVEIAVYHWETEGGLGPADGVLHWKGIMFVPGLAGMKILRLSNDPWDGNSE